MEIQVDRVTVEFPRAGEEPASLKEWLVGLGRPGRRKSRFRALDQVSFSVERGEVLGIVGANGSGKSTLLKVISGALVPTAGRVAVCRDKVRLLTLGTGFDPELTGRENVYLNGALTGYTREELDRRFPEIVAFSELEGFLEEKVRNYSAGMVSRLAFAIATAREAPGILILDEVLSVGDLFFRQKSEARIRQLIHGGSTVLLVSHSPGVIRQNCTRALWLDRGRLRLSGDPDTVCAAYEGGRDQ